MTRTVAPGQVPVWYAHTEEVWPEARAEARAVDAWLLPAERARYARFRRPIDRAMFLLGRVMARTLVARALGCAPLDWRWREGDRGRPDIEGTSALSFNIAHSAGLVVCALAGDSAVGVDVEHRLRPVVDPSIVPRYFSPAEAADIHSQGPDGWHDRFLQYWTLKEAYLKARGLGISVQLADLSFSIAPAGITLGCLGSLAAADCAWAFDLRGLDEAYYLALAVPLGAGGRPAFTYAPLPLDWIADAR